MKRNMSKENVFEFFLISQQHSELELSQVAIKFFIENSEDIIETKMWTEFMIRCSGETCVLIKALVKQNRKCICNSFFHI